MTIKSKKELYELDPLLPEALQLAVVLGEISIVAIQRTFTIGYPRAARLLDTLVAEGFIDDCQGGPRKVLLSKEQYCALYGVDPESLKR